MHGGTLGPYRLDRELGAGGMGTVWRAEVVGTPAGRAAALDAGAVVALKLVHPHLLESPGFFRRFLREAEIGRSVRHENVVRTYECDQVVADGRPQSFLVMEYVEGQTLRGLLGELGRVPEELCRHIGREVARGLAAIHAAGALHRDMKPENVLITRDHAVKVMDLGVARLQDEALRLSQTGAFVGSLHYAAPEAFRDGGKLVDGRADLHALGLVLYELACGVNPYFADDIPQTLRKVLHETPRRLAEANPQLSPFFEELVHRLLAKEPGERFASADELARVLDQGEESAWWKGRAQAIRAETKRPLRRIRIPRETALYGRDAELAKLRALFAAARAGDGAVVVVEGEAGIGKSRIVDELVGQLQREGEDLNFLFGSYPPGGAATASGAFSTAYREQFGEPGSASYLAQTPILVPAFDALLRGETTPAGVERLTKDSIQTCFVHATRGLAAERTTIVLIDDLHFAPEEGRSLFAALAMAVPGHRILLVGTTRPGLDETWLAGMDRIGAARIALPRLGAKDLVRLLIDTLRSERVAEELVGRIALKSDGNPFFVFEIIRGLREGQFITQRDDGTWVSTREIGEIRIPSSVLDLVNARVADLSEEERDLLDVACCWGFEFDPGLIGDVLGVGRIPLLKRFGQIERRHRLVRASGRNYAFDHHQVQEALYGSLHEQMRETYHAALAAALEARSGAAEREPGALDGAVCVDLCDHFLRGAQIGPALRYLEAAEAHLERSHLHAQVVALTERALAAPGALEGQSRAKALLVIVRALGRMGRRAQQETCAIEADRLADASGDGDLRGRAAIALSSLYSLTSRFAEAETAARRALAIARATGDRGAEGVALGELGMAVDAQGRAAEGEAHVVSALEIARETGDRRMEASFLGFLGNLAANHGRPSEASAYYLRHLAVSREIGHRQGEANALTNLGMSLWSSGRIAEAKEHLDRALALHREVGDRMGEAIGALNVGIVLSSAGRLVEARDSLERAAVLCREVGRRAYEANATSALGTVLLFLGRHAEAKESIERSLALSREVGHRRGVGNAVYGLGQVLREAGDLAASEASFRSCLSHCADTGDRVLEAGTHLALGSLLAAARGAEAGRASLERARDLGGEIGSLGPPALARCELALLPGGEPDDALAALAEYEERLDPDERREARLLVWRATGDRAHLVEAKRLLDEAVVWADDETRARMLTNVRVNREIVEACTAAGL